MHITCMHTNNNVLSMQTDGSAELEASLIDSLSKDKVGIILWFYYYHQQITQTDQQQAKPSAN